MTTATEKAAAYDRQYGGSIDDFGQKVERQERIELKQRKRSGGSGRRCFTVPDLPWHRQEANQ